VGKLNVDPLVTFDDGSELLVSTQFLGTAGFSCALYISAPCERDKLDLRVVSVQLEARTCWEAHESVFLQARQLYPDPTVEIKRPPYLIWPGPNLPVPPEVRGRRKRQARG
jgi:hypothetical protein